MLQLAVQKIGMKSRYLNETLQLEQINWCTWYAYRNEPRSHLFYLLPHTVAKRKNHLFRP